MESNTFSLEEIRRELARLGYDGLSKQTLTKFQQDLEELAESDRSQSMDQEFSLSTLVYFIDSHEAKRTGNQRQSNVDFEVKLLRRFSCFCESKNECLDPSTNSVR